MKLVTTKTFYFIFSMTFNFDSRRLYDEYILWKKKFFIMKFLNERIHDYSLFHSNISIIFRL